MPVNPSHSAGRIVSVVIPTRDGRKTLHRALQSLRSSSDYIKEVILVLSNSPEEMRGFCARELDGYRELFDVVVLDSGCPSNGSIARNIGIARASAEYIALLDDDDQWLDFKLSRYFHYIETHELDGNIVVFSRAISCAEDGTAATLFPPDPYRGEPIAEFIFAARGGAQTSALLLAAGLAKHVRFDDTLVRHQDYDFCLRLEQAGAKLHFLDEILSIWYQHSDGVSKSATFDDCSAWAESNRPRLTRSAYINYVEKELFASARRTGRLTEYFSFLSHHLTLGELPLSLMRHILRVLRSGGTRLRRLPTAAELLARSRLEPDEAQTNRPRASSNLRWVAASQAARIGTQSIGMLIFARLLTPSDFGLVAMTVVVANLANILRDMGTAAAVIQRKTLDQRTAEAAFWFSAGLSTLIGAFICLAAPLIAWCFHSPVLTTLLRLLSISFPLAGLGSVHQALLERQSRFSIVARIEIVSGLLALAIAAAIAATIGGPYSLVSQAVIYSALMSTQLWLVSPWRPRRMGCEIKSLREIWRFSGNLFAFNIINYSARNTDSMLLGRVAGPGELGPYSLAYRLMLLPVQNLAFVAGRALLPVFSRGQDDLGHLRNLYLQTLSVIAAISAPLMCFIFVLRADLVSVFFGPDWQMVADLLAWLAPVGFIQSLVSTTGTVFMARGKTRRLMYLGITFTFVQVSGFVIGLPWGARGVAVSYLVSNVFSAVPCLYLALRELGGGFIELAVRMLRIGAAVVFTGGGVYALDRALGEVSTWLTINLLVSGLVGTLIYLAVLRRVAPEIIQHAKAILPGGWVSVGLRLRALFRLPHSTR